MSIDPASLAITAALSAASMALNMTKKIEGPRLTDLSVTVADYGTPYNYFYGIRRLELACIYAEPIQERKRKRKSKGGKYKEYTYFGTWACVISDHLIDEVTRIWFDRHLVYDKTNVGGDSLFSLSDGYELDNAIRIYKGTETQLPDPRLQATVEAAEGAGTAPAFRGRAYIFFEDIPLEKLGNRLPQVSVEVIRGSTTKTINLESASIPVSNEEGVFVLNPLSRELVQIADTTGPILVFGADDLQYRRNAGASAFATGAADLAGRTFAQSGSTNNAPLFSYRTANGNQGFRLGTSSTSTEDFKDEPGRAVGFVNAGNWFAMTNLSGSGPQNSYLMHASGSSVTQGYSLLWVDGIAEVTHVNGSIDLGTLAAVLTATATEANFPGGTFDFSAVIPDHDRGVFYSIMEFPGEFQVWRIAPGGSAFQTFPTVQVGSISRDSPGATFPSSNGIGGWAVNRATGELILQCGSVMALYNPITDTVVATNDTSTTLRTIYNYYSGQEIGYINETANKAVLLDANDLTEILEVGTGTVPELSAAEPGSIWDNERKGIIFKSSSTIYRLTLNIIAAGGYPLADVISDICDRSGMRATDYDVSQVTDTLLGYSWTQGGGREIIEPLLDLYDVDARPHNFQLEFLPRGNSAGGTISSEFFVRESAEDARYEIDITNDTDIPHRIFLNFADPAHEQQVNSAVARRDPDAVDSTRELSIDLQTLVLPVSEARQLVERLLRRRWFARETIRCAVTAQELALEPADVRTLDLDDVPIIARLVRSTIGSNGVLDQVWERDLTELNTLTSNTGADMLGRPPAQLLLPGLTQGYVLDVPLLLDTQESATPFIYLGAAPYSDDQFWPGADFLISATGAADDFEAGWFGLGTSESVSWAICLDTLGDAVEHVIDGGNELNVRLQSGTLASVTRDQMVNDRSVNLALIGSPDNGWEAVQFQTATLEADGTYTLTNFIRGVQGTESQMGAHGAGESLVLASAIQTRTIGASKIGVTDYYRVVTQGRDQNTANTITVPYTAAYAKPLSPANVELERDSGSGDWTISWVRRTRYGGALLDGRDVPLGETSESYKVQIMDGTTVVRTIEVTSETATYTAAEQTTDWGSAQTSLSVRVLQVSPSLSLDGFYTAASA